MLSRYQAWIPMEVLAAMMAEPADNALERRVGAAVVGGAVGYGAAKVSGAVAVGVLAKSAGVGAAAGPVGAVLGVIVGLALLGAANG